MATSIKNEKKIILDNILRAVILTGIALSVIATVRDFYAGVAILNALINWLVLLFLIGILTFGKRLTLGFKTWILIVTTVFMGTKVILVNGIQMGTFYFFLVSAIICLLILKEKIALWTILLFSLVYLTFITLMGFSALIPSIDFVSVDIRIRWVAEICLYFFMLFIITGGVGRMQRTFVKSIEELDESNQKLNQYNEELAISS